jgi:hypothetical protein
MADPRRGGSPTLEPRDRERPSNGGRNSTGARAVGAEHRRRRGILPLLLGLLALLAIGALLAALLNGGDDDSATQSGQAQQQQDDQATQAQGGGGEGTLTASGTSVLPGDPARIGDAVSRTAEGKAVVVQSVVQNADDPQALEGFWVGSSEQDRVYVEWGGDVGADEADFQPEAGQRVNLVGPVKAAPQEAARVLNLDGADARLVEEQGAYVNADQVTAAR